MKKLKMVRFPQPLTFFDDYASSYDTSLARVELAIDEERMFIMVKKPNRPPVFVSAAGCVWVYEDYVTDDIDYVTPSGAVQERSGKDYVTDDMIKPYKPKEQPRRRGRPRKHVAESDCE